MKTKEEKIRKMVHDCVSVTLFNKKAGKPTYGAKILEYLSKKKRTLLKHGNIHRYHIVDLPYYLRKNGY